MIVNYAEKAYESFYCSEVISKNLGNYFSPSQHFENYIGCDSIVDFHDSCVKYSAKDLQGIEKSITKNLNQIPIKMSFSAFIQFKRPELMVSDRAKEWSHYEENYYRFKIDKDQLNQLQKIDNKLTELDVFYSIPFIPDNNALYDIHLRREIIDNSISLGVNEVNGHKVVCYDLFGSTILGFSKPEFIQKNDFLLKAKKESEKSMNKEENLSENNSSIDNSGFSELVHNIAKKLGNLMGDNFNRSFQMYSKLEEVPIKNLPSLYSLLYINEVLKYLDLSWLLGTNANNSREEQKKKERSE